MNETRIDRHTLVIVDDDPQNLGILRRILTAEGYDVYQSNSGHAALEMAQTTHPDLLLLDVILPDLDGYEVCRRLKTNDTTRDLPILFISGLEDRQEKVRAFEAGGVDYILKPFQSEEVLVRVRTHLSLRDSQKRLQAQNQQLQQELHERKHAEQIQAALYRISEATQTIARLHDLFPALREIIGALMPVANFYIAFYDPDANLISFPYYIENNTQIKRAPRPFGKGLAEHVLRTGEPLLLTPQSRQALINNGEMKPVEFMPTVVDWLGVPLKTSEQILGLITVQSHSPNVRLGEDEKQVLLFMSGQIASAIERKRSEELLHHLKTAVETTEIGITITDIEGQILYVNPADAAMHGYTVEELRGQPSNLFRGPEFRHITTSLFLEGEEIPLWTRERFNRRKDGSLFPVRLVSNPIYDDDGRRIGQVTICEDIMERKQAERRLQESEERYRGLVENAPIGIFQATPEGRFLAANPALARMLGYASVTELLVSVTDIGANVYVDPRHWREMIDVLRASPETARIETRYHDKEGGVLIVSLSVWAGRDDHGRLHYVEGLVEDITEHKHTDRLLFQQANLLRSVAGAQIALLVNPNLETALMEGFELLGFTTEVDRIYMMENVTQPETGEACMRLRFEWVKDAAEAQMDNPALQQISYHPDYSDWYATLSTQKIVQEMSPLNPSSQRALFEAHPPLTTLLVPIVIRNQFRGFLGFDDCYTRRNWREEEKSALLAIAGGVGGALARWQAEANLIAANTELKATLEDLKRAQAQLILAEKMAALGQLVAGIAHEVNTPLAAIRSAIGDITATLDDTFERLPDFFAALPPDRRALFFALLQQSRQKGNLLSLAEKRAAKRAISGQLKELHLEHSRKIAEILMDLGLAENLTPFLPLLQAPDAEATLAMAYRLAGLHESAQTVATAVERASKVAFALKTYAHYDHSGAPIAADLVANIETVLTLYHNKLKQNIEVIFQYDELPPLECFPDELSQVWTNLLHNALHAMDYKGTLTITIRREEAQVIVSLTDTGKGIPKELQARIFEPFFTTKPRGEGSGLGLSTVKKIIDKHHGQIQVESQPGRTTFQVILPLRQA